jgi:hypothetical protein
MRQIRRLTGEEPFDRISEERAGADMIIRSTAILGLLASFTISAPLWAKGDMVLVEIKGASLKSPIQITDPRIEEFNIWVGFIIDWQAGVVAQRPSGLQHYEVSFYAGCRTPERWNSNVRDCLAEKPRLAYVVSYDYDPSSKRGFVYLPGKGDPFYYVNLGSIGHSGREGNWFLATASWEDFVRPLIANAQNN